MIFSAMYLRSPRLQVELLGRGPVYNDAKSWFNQLHAVAQCLWPVSVVAGYLSRLCVFLKSNDIAGFSGTNACYLSILCRVITL